jgi:Family of unknown function (DUF6200)
MASPTAPNDPAATAAFSPIVVDLGKHGRKRVKQLREGRGKLMAEIAQAVEELQAAGTVAPGSTPVVVIVRQKPRKTAWPLG